MFKKRLKKISYDLVSYIQIETEAIRDYNDKQILSSYCLHKLEVVKTVTGTVGSRLHSDHGKSLPAM